MTTISFGGVSNVTSIEFARALVETGHLHAALDLTIPEAKSSAIALQKALIINQNDLEIMCVTLRLSEWIRIITEIAFQMRV